MKTEVTLDLLAAQYAEAKQVEEEAIASRRAIGKLIEDALPGPDEGSVNARLPAFKVSVTRKVTRKVDSDALGKAWEFISENVQNTFKWEASINTKHLRALQELSAADLELANKYYTTKPASSTITVEKI